MEQNKNQTQQINIELGEKEAEGIYSNLAILAHSQSEFIFDFTKILPGVQKPKVQARIIMTPMHAKRFLMALQENIVRFEAANGEIKINPGNADPFGFAPGSPKIN